MEIGPFSAFSAQSSVMKQTHGFILLILVIINAEKRGVFLVKRDAPTFNVTLWSLRPCRMLVPLPIRSSMPRWAFWRDSLNCNVSSIGMVVSESCGGNAGSRLPRLLAHTDPEKRTCRNKCGENLTGFGRMY